MVLYCTYCSAEKNYSETPTPAIELYKNERITDVYHKAKQREVGFAILSGKFGIVEAQQPIAYYDHLLTAEEVDVHSELVATQLVEMGVSKVIFYTVSVRQDQNLEAYITCIHLATEKCGVNLELKEIN
jgi:hypothetical protein